MPTHSCSHYAPKCPTDLTARKTFSEYVWPPKFPGRPRTLVRGNLRGISSAPCSAFRRWGFRISVHPNCLVSGNNPPPRIFSVFYAKIESMNCLFCRIVAGEIPATKIFEDHDSIAFADINPQAPTHFLVIPKKHIDSLALATEDRQGNVGSSDIGRDRAGEKKPGKGFSHCH